MEKQDKTPGEYNPAYMLAQKLRENKSSLHIARIPKNTREKFIAMADEEFCSDYGMLLKYLLDKVVEYNMDTFLEKLQEHENRIQALEKEETSSIKTLSGKEIKKEVEHE